MIHMLGFAAAFLACLTYAFIAGGKPERAAMLAQLLALLLSILAMSFRWELFRQFPIGLALVDISLAVALTCLALRANRLWPVVLAGLQLATTFAHLAKWLGFPIPTAGYAIFVQLWAWPMLIVTAIGTYNHRRRTAKYGQEPDWKPLWPHSVQAGFTT